MAFGAVRQFVDATLMKPNFALGPMGTSRTVQVDTHAGPVPPHPSTLSSSPMD